MEFEKEHYQVVGKLDGNFKIFKDYITNRYEAELFKEELEILGDHIKDVTIYKIK